MQTTYTTDRDLDNALFAWRSWCRAERSTTAGYPSHAAGCRWRASRAATLANIVNGCAV